MATCPRCGQKSSGWFKPCGLCKQETTISSNLDAEKKNPKRPIKEPED